MEDIQFVQLTMFDLFAPKAKPIHPSTLAHKTDAVAVLDRGC